MLKEIDKHTFLLWWKDPRRTGEGVTPEQIFQAGIDAERKRLSNHLGTPLITRSGSIKEEEIPFDLSLCGSGKCSKWCGLC